MGCPVGPGKPHHPGSLSNAEVLGRDQATMYHALGMPWLFVVGSGGLLASIPAFPSVLCST